MVKLVSVGQLGEVGYKAAVISARCRYGRPILQLGHV